MSDRERQRRAEQHRRSYTINEWCDARRVSRAMFYKLSQQDSAPRTHNVGVKRLISDAADAEWIAAREAERTNVEPNQAA